MVAVKEHLQKKNETVKYYPDESYFKNYNFIKINLDSINMKFDNISELVNEIHRKDSFPYFKLKSGSLTRNIGILRNNTGHIKQSSVLSIGKDSIYIDSGYTIDNLAFLMKRHFENNGKNPLYPINAQNALMLIDLKSNSDLSDLKKY